MRTRTPKRTDKLAPVRCPERSRTLQGKDAHARVVCARVHQNVQVEPLEQRVVRRAVGERYEHSRGCCSGAVAAGFLAQ